MNTFYHYGDNYRETYERVSDFIKVNNNQFEFDGKIFCLSSCRRDFEYYYKDEFIISSKDEKEIIILSAVDETNFSLFFEVKKNTVRVYKWINTDMIRDL